MVICGTSEEFDDELPPTIVATCRAIVSQSTPSALRMSLHVQYGLKPALEHRSDCKLAVSIEALLHVLSA